MSSRSFIQRTCVVIGLLVISACLFFIGKGHTIFLDTNTLTIDGKELRSLQSVTVSVNGKQAVSYMGRAERVRVNVSGPWHTIEIVDDNDPSNKIEKAFTLQTFMERVILSLPAIIGGASQEHWITEFTPPPLVDAPVEKMQWLNDPVEPKVDEPVEPKVDEPVEPKVDEPVEPEADEPAEPEADESAEPNVNDPVEPETDDPVDPEN